MTKNQRRPVVAIQLGDRTRHLHFTYNALAELEAQALRFEGRAPSRALLRAAVWAGILEETLDARGRETAQTPSIFEVGQWLDAVDDTEPIAAAVFEAMAISRVPESDRPTPAGREEGTLNLTTSSPGPSAVTTLG